MTHRHCNAISCVINYQLYPKQSFDDIAHCPDVSPRFRDGM